MPAVIPFERAIRFEMAMNLNAAKLLGVKSPEIIVRATRVIE